eukprot:gene30492-35510_t
MAINMQRMDDAAMGEMPLEQVLAPVPLPPELSGDIMTSDQMIPPAVWSEEPFGLEVTQGPILGEGDMMPLQRVSSLHLPPILREREEPDVADLLMCQLVMGRPLRPAVTDLLMCQLVMDRPLRPAVADLLMCQLAMQQVGYDTSERDEAMLQLMDARQRQFTIPTTATTITNTPTTIKNTTNNNTAPTITTITPSRPCTEGAMTPQEETRPCAMHGGGYDTSGRGQAMRELTDTMQRQFPIPTAATTIKKNTTITNITTTIKNTTTTITNTPQAMHGGGYDTSGRDHAMRRDQAMRELTDAMQRQLELLTRAVGDLRDERKSLRNSVLALVDRDGVPPPMAQHDAATQQMYNPQRPQTTMNPTPDDIRRFMDLPATTDFGDPNAFSGGPQAVLCEPGSVPSRMVDALPDDVQQLLRRRGPPRGLSATPIDLAIEAKDPRMASDVVFQFLAYRHHDTLNAPTNVQSIYFTFQFYHFPPTTSEMAYLVQPPPLPPTQNAQGSINRGDDTFATEQMEASLSSTRILVTNHPMKKGAGITLKYNVDGTLEPLSSGQTLEQAAFETAMQFAQYLGAKKLSVDVWDGESLLQIGTATLDLQSLLRQGRDFAELLVEVPILDQSMVLPELIGTATLDLQSLLRQGRDFAELLVEVPSKTKAWCCLKWFEGLGGRVPKYNPEQDQNNFSKMQSRTSTIKYTPLSLSAAPSQDQNKIRTSTLVQSAISTPKYTPKSMSAAPSQDQNKYSEDQNKYSEAAGSFGPGGTNDTRSPTILSKGSIVVRLINIGREPKNMIPGPRRDLDNKSGPKKVRVRVRPAWEVRGPIQKELANGDGIYNSIMQDGERFLTDEMDVHGRPIKRQHGMRDSGPGPSNFDPYPHRDDVLRESGTHGPAFGRPGSSKDFGFAGSAVP